MTQNEKCELLKNTIAKLYSKEGRSFNYISSLLELDRKTLTNKIKNEWKLPVAPPMKRVLPSTQKFINKNREMIKSRLDHDMSITQIAKELGVDRSFLSKTIISSDVVLSNARDQYLQRMHMNAITKRENKMKQSSRDYLINDLPDEKWVPILGYENYYVSDMGRIKKKVERYHAFYLIKSVENSEAGKVYVTIQKNGKRKTFQLSRIVAHAFVDGRSEDQNTVNHKDGNPHNNEAVNLEWVSQAENNLHAYRDLHRNIVNKRRYHFKKIRYQKQYEFCTVAAFAKFIGKSETQARRMLDHPEKYNIELIR